MKTEAHRFKEATYGAASFFIAIDRLVVFCPANGGDYFISGALQKNPIVLFSQAETTLEGGVSILFWHW
jgi:hypothetical protein